MPLRRPTYAHVVEALCYREVVEGMTEFFISARMEKVGKCLAEAQREIDRIWEEGDFLNSEEVR